MPTLPPTMLALLAPFAPLCSERVWCHALVLVAGTLLAPGRRTVCACLGSLSIQYRLGQRRRCWRGPARG